MRHALYFTPDPASPLVGAAEDWLGRSAFPGQRPGGREASTRLGPEDRRDLVASAARYGFHATLKAPFRLAADHSHDDLLRAVLDWSNRHAAVGPVELTLVQIDGFFALVPARASPRLDAFAAAVVRDFDAFRAPLSASERARRRPERLSAREREHLDRWGYPYVMDAFRFHMTLTDRVAPDASDALRDELMARFAPFLQRPVEVDALAVFTEASPGGPFEVAAHHRLTGERDFARACGG